MNRRLLTLVAVAIVVGSASAAANTPPVASFQIWSASGVASPTVVLDATASLDPDGTIVSYQWLFGDSTTGSGETKTHTYPDMSSYTVTLLVRDDQGATQQTTRVLDFSNPPPTQASPGDDGGSAPVVQPSNAPIGTRAGERAPDFELPDADGDLVQLSDYLGQVVLLEFWSSSCSACQAAMPHLEELREAYEEQGLVVLALSINRDFQGAVDYLYRNGYTEFTVIGELDPINKPIMDLYGVSRIPHAFLIDRTGVIRFTGHMNLLQAEAIEPWL